MCVILNRVRALTLADRQVQAEENEVVWHSYPLPIRVISTDSARRQSTLVRGTYADQGYGSRDAACGAQYKQHAAGRWNRTYQVSIPFSTV